MKNNRRVLLGCLYLIFLGISMSSCNTPGFYPLYDEQNISKVPGLEGKWKGVNPTTSWEFKPAADGYILTFSEGKKSNSAEFIAKVLTLDGKYYVDLMLNTDAENNLKGIFHKKKIINSLLLNSMMPVHQYARLTIKKDSLFVGLLEFPKTDTLPVSHPDYLPYLHGNVDLLIATTKQMQSYIKRHPNTMVSKSKQTSPEADYLIIRR